MANKYLTLAGLTKYDGLIKTFINDADVKAIKYGKVENGHLLLYKSENPGSSATPDFDLILPAADLAPYELKTHAGDIPSGATATTITGYAKEAADATELAAKNASAVTVTKSGQTITLKQGGTSASDVIGTFDLPDDVEVITDAEIEALFPST